MVFLRNCEWFRMVMVYNGCVKIEVVYIIIKVVFVIFWKIILINFEWYGLYCLGNGKCLKVVK